MTKTLHVNLLRGALADTFNSRHQFLGLTRGFIPVGALSFKKREIQVLYNWFHSQKYLVK